MKVLACTFFSFWYWTRAGQLKSDPVCCQTFRQQRWLNEAKCNRDEPCGQQFIMSKEEERIMHNYWQLSRGRGGGNKWSCQALATNAHWATRGRGRRYRTRMGVMKMGTWCQLAGHFCLLLQKALVPKHIPSPIILLSIHLWFKANTASTFPTTPCCLSPSSKTAWCWIP